MICYTAIYGSYDVPHPHAEHPDVDAWVCYTDDPDLEAPGWTVIVDPPRYPHPRLAAKWHKCHAPNGESLWIDGSVELHDAQLVDVVLETFRDTDAAMTMFAHPWRDCIYDEVGASIGMLKYAGLPLDRQVAHYAANGWKPHAGLWASTVIGRSAAYPTSLAAFGAAWFAHCETFTYQDQLSLPYLLDRYGIPVVALPYELHDNPWFFWCSHTRDD